MSKRSGARILAPIPTLLGQARKPGDRLSAKQLARIPPKNRLALINQGVLDVSGDTYVLSDTEVAAEKEVESARQELGKARQVRNDLKAKRDETEANALALTKERGALSLKAAKGNGGTAPKLDKLRKQGTALALDLDDLAEAIVAADAGVMAAEEELGQAERKRHWAGIDLAKDEIVARAKVADIELTKAGISIAKLRQGLRQWASQIGTDNENIHNEWWLESAFKAARGEPVESSNRIESLTAYIEHLVTSITEQKMRSTKGRDHEAATKRGA